MDTNLNLIKQAKALAEEYQGTQSKIEDFIEKSKNPDVMLAGVVKYMKVLGSSNPTRMKDVKELCAELDDMLPKTQEVKPAPSAAVAASPAKSSAEQH